jgi:hypothetical protein
LPLARTCDNREEGTWKDIGSAFDLPATGDWSASVIQHLRRAVPEPAAPVTASTVPLDQAALDQAFAQTAPEDGYLMEPE